MAVSDKGVCEYGEVIAVLCVGLSNSGQYLRSAICNRLGEAKSSSIVQPYAIIPLMIIWPVKVFKLCARASISGRTRLRNSTIEATSFFARHFSQLL